MSIRVIASSRNWIEGSAVDQLRKTAELPGMVAAVGMPDLHPGKGTPIGAVFASQGIIYPHLVGNDIGCGMGFWQTDVWRRKAKLEKWFKKLDGLESPWDGDTEQWLKPHGVESGGFEVALGTIGGGNHFAELQRVDRVIDQERFSSIGLDADRLFLLVHSGSRGLGEHILQQHLREYGASGISAGSQEAARYLRQHDHAIAWARANRALIATRFLAGIGATAQCVLDVFHNFVQSGTVNGALCWLHRKGATPADAGLVVIPGSRGALSYLVEPTTNQGDNLCTLAHGAGRRWSRSGCRARLEKRFSPDNLIKTGLGSYVICEDRALLFEEAPEAYKDVDIVVGDLVEGGFVSMIATFVPLITYKTRGRDL